jgi:4-hydroxybenzoate polyprenyltransferase
MHGRGYRWLALIPALGILFGVPFANQVHRYVLGLPFLLAWILACVLLTSALMAVIEELDRRRDAEDSRSRFG